MKLIAKNWKQFQHYARRSPPWIKLHRSLLDDYDFYCLPVASKALAPMLWLIASEYQNGEIDADITRLSFRVRMSEKELKAALKPLIDHGFFTDASNTLADRYHDAIPEERRDRVETETEREGETEKIAPKRATQLASDFQPTDDHQALARELGINLSIELPKFQDYHRAKGSTMKDWNAALRTWIRNARAFAKPEKLNAINKDFSKVDWHKGVNEDGSF